MKKHLLLFIALVAFNFTMNAQQRMVANLTPGATVGNFEIQQIMSSFDAKTNIGTIALGKLQQGRNHLLTDRRTGRKLMLLAERQGARVRVAGFMIQEKDGRYFQLPDSNVGKAKPGDSFGCPDNWDAQLICYTHPTYNVKVCYLRCTPTELTLKFPPSF